MAEGTLIYSPGVSIVIETSQHGMIDVSQDCSSGSLTLRENGAHNLNITIENPNRKYDGIFCPNDRIVVQMKRTRWLQVFAGYIDSAPYFSTFARPVELTAQCSLKVFKNWPWDRGSVKAIELLNRGRSGDDVRTAQDGGMAQIVTNLITQVTNWPAEKVHIGRVPEDWYAKFERVYTRLDDVIKTEYDPIIGVNPIIAGKPVGGLGGSPGISTGAIGTFVPGSESQLEAMTAVDADVDIILQTIRTLESGNNYTATNKGDGRGDWATGAYQFTDGTWNNYRGYKRAYEAPKEIQDERARGDVRGLLSRYGPKVMNIPCGWYYPVSLREPAWLDKIPAAHEGNTLTIRQYAHKWLKKYVEIFTQVRGGPPPSFSGATGSTAQPSSAGVIYPIPDGVKQLSSAKDAWGGYTNGQVPMTAMKYEKRTGYGHPVAIQAYMGLLAAADAAGFDLSGGCYRSREAQANVGSMGAPPGKSVHGWGLALDVSVLVPNASITKKYKGYTNTQMYTTPEYEWMKANAYKFGWGHPDWAQQGGSKPEAWHWEFFAFRGLTPGSSQVQGVNPFDSAAAGNGMQGGISGTPSSLALFSALNNWMHPLGEDAGLESKLLFGYKALMNDEPIMVAIDQFTKAAGRSYCTAPNGDFIAWWPDYWGEYGLAGIIDVEAIELKDFTVNYSDENLITHQFVEGAYLPSVDNPLPMGLMSSLSAIQTRGVAAIDMPNFLEAIVNVKDSSQYPWMQDPAALLHRFGARVSRSKNTAIIGPHQEFFDAVQRFTRAWASQFSARAPMTFMPEMYPGMLMRLPLYKVQMYVQSVTHSWNYAGGEGFTTTANTMAVSATGGSGFFMFPKGGDLRPIGSGRGRGLYL